MGRGPKRKPSRRDLLRRETFVRVKNREKVDHGLFYFLFYFQKSLSVSYIYSSMFTTFMFFILDGWIWGLGSVFCRVHLFCDQKKVEYILYQVRTV